MDFQFALMLFQEEHGTATIPGVRYSVVVYCKGKFQRSLREEKGKKIEGNNEYHTDR